MRQLSGQIFVRIWWKRGGSTSPTVSMFAAVARQKQLQMHTGKSKQMDCR